jgi:translocation and assembly module TamB
VLSLIIFGRYVSQLSAFQALELVNGLAELSGRKGIGVLGKLRQGVGLDELDVTTTETGATEITAGKYITEDIYTDVTTNDQLGTDISLNVDLTDDLTAKATVGEEGEGSIGLFFERDY